MSKIKKAKDTMLTDQMSGFQEKEINYAVYEVSFRRWLVSQIDSGKMSIHDARDRFNLGKDFARIIKNWQERYSEQLHLSLQAMTAKERADNGNLEKRVKELEKQLELARMKIVALDTMIDIAEQDYKLEIRKKSGPKR
jgi:hypothetical protein